VGINQEKVKFRAHEKAGERLKASTPANGSSYMSSVYSTFHFDNLIDDALGYGARGFSIIRVVREQSGKPIEWRFPGGVQLSSIREEQS
jgi:hypothetical protein